MEKNFDINREGCSVRCLLFCENQRAIRQAVIYVHGFGGHKDSRAARRFAGYVLSKRHDTAVVCFDLPCHGADGRKKLLLGDCDTYLRLAADAACEQLGAERLFAFGASFGGYLLLRYIAGHDSPFEKIALRSPAVRMYEALTERIVSPEELEKLEKGRDVLVGFDRKVKISRDFLRSLREEDITRLSFLDHCEELFIVHGTKDEIIPIEPVAAFADDNLIPFLAVENADHRFIDPVKMDLSIRECCKFYWE